MKYTIALIAASAALVRAQAVPTITPNGTEVCPSSKPNGDFCAGGPIIIRCNNGIGQPGNCDDNLAGYPPLGDNPSTCYESAVGAGDAACAKNCIVYGASGNANGTFTIPGCTPYYTATSSTSSSTSTSSATTTSSTSSNTTSSGQVTSTTITSTGTTTYCPSSGTTTTKTFTTTYCPSSSGSIIVPPPMSTGTGTGSGGSGPGKNGTSGGSGSGSSSSSATATPVGPTKSSSSVGPQFTGAAIANAAPGAMAAVGLFAAYFL